MIEWSLAVTNFSLYYPCIHDLLSHPCPCYSTTDNHEYILYSLYIYIYSNAQLMGSQNTYTQGEHDYFIDRWIY